MLNHTVLGPTFDGRYLVVYPTPGCSVMTTACDCRSAGQANAEAARLNALQVTREEAIREGRLQRGIDGVYPGLEGNG